MSATDTTSQVCWEGKDATCMARVTLSGSNITQSDVSAIQRKIYDRTSSTPSTAIDDTALTVSSAVFNTLQTDGRWTKDSTGYNFRDTVAGAKIPDGNHTYIVEYHFTGANSELFAVVFALLTKELQGT